MIVAAMPVGGFTSCTHFLLITLFCSYFCVRAPRTDPRSFHVQPLQPPPPQTVTLPQSLIYNMSSDAFSRPLLEPMASAWKEGEV